MGKKGYTLENTAICFNDSVNLLNVVLEHTIG